MSSDEGTKFLQWALPRLGYRWNGFRKPRGQVLKRVKSRIQELNLSGGYSEYKHFLQKNQDEWQVLDRLHDKIKKGSILITGSNEKEPLAKWLKRIVKAHPVFKAV